MTAKEMQNTIEYTNKFVKDIPTRIVLLAILEHLQDTGDFE